MYEVVGSACCQAASSSDSDYSGLDAVDVEVTNLDDENQAPVVTLPLGDISYGIGGIGVGIDAKATVSDSDSSKYTGGTLTVTLTANTPF